MESICEFVKDFYMERLRADLELRQALLKKLDSLTVESNEQMAEVLAEIVLTEAVTQAGTELTTMGSAGEQATPSGRALRTGRSTLHPNGCLLLLIPEPRDEKTGNVKTMRTGQTTPIPAMDMMRGMGSSVSFIPPTRGIGDSA